MYSIDKKTILKKYFGYDDFREGQEYLIDCIMEQKNVLGVMPTGAGKSICFQVPALIFSGITIVISPLISLMKDQVNSLTQSGVKAAFLNSSLTSVQYNKVIQNAYKGIYKIIYVAPERLLVDDFLVFAKTTEISMITIDEAHCISQWGQDFRPSYLKIIDFIKRLEIKPVISAFTATATLQVRDDILNSLHLSNADVLVTGFDRKNLYFEVKKPKDKYKELIDFLYNKKHKTGIIYCSTRKNVESVCEKLNKNGYKATRYHAGLSDNERKENQDDFTFDKVKIIVATNAFGMGIDKSNVSFVVHYNMPKDIESYYQEAGRAGRDGEDAHCLLLYSGQDVRTNLYFIENSLDSEYESKEIEEIAKERDRQRLKIMTFYCHTNDCLRQYILKYFGEKSTNFCSNCSSCNSNFEEIDITIESQKILSCVVRLKERYGAKMVTDILRGSKNEKILRLGFDQLSTYNITQTSEKRIRDIISYLSMNQYLISTDDEYPVLKLGNKAIDFLKKRQNLTIKLAKDYEKILPKENTISHPINKNLLDKLKKLRLEIASEQKVPAFVVFSDSSLIDMCIKLPINENQFLEVSGVGNAKLEKYGKQFLEKINNFETDDSNIDSIEEEKLDSVLVSDEPIPISILADNINVFRLQNNLKKISHVKIANWLVNNEYLKIEKNEDEENCKVITGKGKELGIISETKISSIGKEYKSNFYSKGAQEFLIDRLESISIK